MRQKKKVSRRAGSFSAEFRIRVVKLFIEEGYSSSMLAEEFGCGKSTIQSWVRIYREQGESGLERPKSRSNSNTSFHTYNPPKFYLQIDTTKANALIIKTQNRRLF